MIESLPKDVLALIFLRLPVKALLRCFSVCKSWHQFIQHPSFINAHLQHQRRDLMFIRHVPEDNKKKLDSLSFESSSSSYDDDKISSAGKDVYECYTLYDDEISSAYAKHEFPICNPNSLNYRVVGSCNGVICITNDLVFCEHQTYLWNPTIQKCIELPYPMFTFDKIGGFNQELGFGFDEKTNDYKVVRIVQKTDYDAPLEVEIYSLSCGSWRQASHLASDLIDVQFLDRIGNVRDNQVFLNGALHWVGLKFDGEKYRFLVIVFHLSDEVFCCFELPKDINHFSISRIDQKPRPVVFQGFLSFIHFWDHKCSIWMMKIYGDSTSWAKHVDVTLSKEVDRVIGLKRNGELLIEIRGGLYSYDHEATKGKRFNVLNDLDLHVWKLLQGGHQVIRDRWIVGPEPDNKLLPVRRDVLEYDPESAPKELGIRRKKTGDFKFSFHSESYIESLVLLGRVNCNQIENKTEESERRIHEEDDNRVAGLDAEVDKLNVEDRQIGGNSVPL